ncbi:hypothetical protein ASG65_26760 [Bacillus sp. Leaf13]|nr:hypothetical protein ASG65_26760 [Bacillus sp. Leaf13]
MPHYSFIILCHNQWEMTRQAITTLNASISREHKEKGIELIVVNNGSDDETKVGIEHMKVLIKKDIEIVPIHLQENMGLLFAINIGFSRCSGEIITLLNNDLVFPTNWFDGIVKTLNKRSDIGAAAPFLSYASGPANVGVNFGSISEVEEFSQKFMKENRNKVIYIERIIGACVSMKRELVSLIGGNDFWLGYGFFDDDDWSLRACIAGYKLAIVGASFVHHIGNKTIQQHSEATRAAIQANGEKFAKRWNVVGGFDRKKLVNNTQYLKDQHYFPFRIEDFNKPSSPKEKVTITHKREIILVADWSNDRSQWRNTLLKSTEKLSVEGNQHLHLLIPKTYFNETDIINEVKSVLNHNISRIHYHTDAVPPIDLFTFFSQFDVFLAVEDDYVNRYFKYLLANASLEIQ